MKSKKYLMGGGIVGTVLLGIVINALWDFLKPISSFLFNTTLNLSILGVSKFKDGIYQEIARGFHEWTSLQIFIFVDSMFLSLIFVTGIMLVLVRRRTTVQREKDIKRTFVDKLCEFHENYPQKPGFVWFLILYILFSTTIITLDLVKGVYINKTIAYFEQMSKIIHPYITEEQNLKYISEFSQIQNKNDYVVLIKKIEEIAKNNGQKIPVTTLTF